MSWDNNKEDDWQQEAENDDAKEWYTETPKYGSNEYWDYIAQLRAESEPGDKAKLPSDPRYDRSISTRTFFAGCIGLPVLAITILTIMWNIGDHNFLGTLEWMLTKPGLCMLVILGCCSVYAFIIYITKPGHKIKK